MKWDPFDFMGVRRGANRPDDPPQRPTAKLQVVTADDRVLAGVCCVLHELNARAAVDDRIVANIASRHGFDCDTPWPGVFTLRYSAQRLVAFLVQEPSTALGAAPGFELFICVDGVQLA